MKRIFLFIGIIYYVGLQAQLSDTSHLSLLFVGDIMGHNAQITAAYNDSTNKYDYTDNFFYVKHIISSADISFANLEVTLAGKPYKGYPRFSSPDNLIMRTP